MTRPARSAARSFKHFGYTRRVALALWSACVLVSACNSGDQHSRYELEKKFFEAEQAWSKVQLERETGSPGSTLELRARYESILEEFFARRPGMGAGDTVLFTYAAGASQHLVELLSMEQQWEDVARLQEKIATDTLFPMAVRHRSLYGWASARERAGQIAEACELYRQLVLSFYPPVAEGGVNADVLALPTRRIALAESALPDSMVAYRTFGERYYDSLATAYPHTQLAFQALGELARIHGSTGRWELTLSTLGRATDTSGLMFPAFQIDRGEIWAGQLHDTARALAAFAEVSRNLGETPFRIDSDLKMAAIWFRRGKYAQVQTLLKETKEAVKVAEADLAVGPLLARSYAASGDRERARAEFSYLVTRYPRSLQAVEAAASISQLHMETKDSAAATLWRARSDSLAGDLVSDPESSAPVVAAALNARASLAVESEQWDVAAMHLTALAQTFGPATPAGATALIRLGWVQLRELDDTLAAAQSWGAFLTAHPDHPDGAGLKTEMNKWPDRYRPTPPS